jgi:hypothetical protein
MDNVTAAAAAAVVHCFASQFKEIYGEGRAL